MKTIAQILVAALFSVLLFFAFWYGRLYEVKPVSAQDKTTTIGVILVGPVRDGGWSEAHYNSFEAIRQRMNLNVLYRESVNTQDGSVVRVIDELVREKAEMIFVLSFSYGQHLQESVKKYPGVKFFHAAGVVQGPNLATYFGRIYQARYLSGIVAGMQSKTGHIGFVGAHPIAEVVQGINAFTLLIRPSLFEIHAAYFTCASWKNFFTRSGDFSKACMWAVAAAFSLALVRTGTFV